VHEELYDLSKDPDETRNLSGSEPQQLQRMRNILRSYEQRVQRTSPGQQGFANEQPMDQDALDAIKAIGY